MLSTQLPFRFSQVYGPITLIVRFRDVVSVSTSRSRLGQNVQCLGLVSVSELCVSVLGLGPKGLGVSSRVSDHFVSSRRFVQTRAVHLVLQY